MVTSIRPAFGPEGLVPAIAQDASSGRVLMLASMNAEAWEATLRTHRATFYSRSRGRLWEKGETSGNTLHVVGITLDCDRDAVLLSVEAGGPACHTGAPACFIESVLGQGPWSEPRPYDRDDVPSADRPGGP